MDIIIIIIKPHPVCQVLSPKRTKERNPKWITGKIR